MSNRVKPPETARSTHPDPFLAQFLAGAPEEVAGTFTRDQLHAIKIAFGAQRQARHPLDLRRSVSLFGRRFYVVLLAGRERRPADRLEREGLISRGADALAMLFALTAVTFTLAAAVFLVEAGLGVEIVPDGGMAGLMSRVDALLAARGH